MNMSFPKYTIRNESIGQRFFYAKVLLSFITDDITSYKHIATVFAYKHVEHLLATITDSSWSFVEFADVSIFKSVLNIDTVAFRVRASP